MICLGTKMNATPHRYMHTIVARDCCLGVNKERHAHTERTTHIHKERERERERGEQKNAQLNATQQSTAQTIHTSIYP